jgi:hypothetical protein
MNIATFWQHTTSRHFRALFYWAGIAMLISAMPALMSWVAATLLSKTLDWRQFVIHGEAAIFSLGIIFSIMESSLKEMRVRFILRSPVTWIALLLMALAVTIYTTITAVNAPGAGQSAGMTLNVPAVIVFSSIVYFSSLALGGVTQWVHEVRKDLSEEDLVASAVEAGRVDLREMLDEPKEHLRAQLSKVEETDGE